MQLMLLRMEGSRSGLTRGEDRCQLVVRVMETGSLYHDRFRAQEVVSDQWE